jgi:hypothetical protein
MRRLLTRRAAWHAALLGLVLACVAVPAAGQTTAANVPATAADAAPFLGDWALTLKGPDRDATFDLTVKTEGEKVVGEIAAGEMPRQFIPETWMAEKALKMRYSFPYQGNEVEAVVMLTPGADGAVAAQIDFAGGAYVMSGCAARKAAKP